MRDLPNYVQKIIGFHPRHLFDRYEQAHKKGYTDLSYREFMLEIADAVNMPT